MTPKQRLTSALVGDIVNDDNLIQSNRMKRGMLHREGDNILSMGGNESLGRSSIHSLLRHLFKPVIADEDDAVAIIPPGEKPYMLVDCFNFIHSPKERSAALLVPNAERRCAGNPQAGKASASPSNPGPSRGHSQPTDIVSFVPLSTDRFDHRQSNGLMTAGRQVDKEIQRPGFAGISSPSARAFRSRVKRRGFIPIDGGHYVAPRSSPAMVRFTGSGVES